MVKIKNFKNDFPFFKKRANEKQCLYFDNAATTQKPHNVIDCLNEFYIYHTAPVHRGIYKAAEHVTMLYEKTRKTVQQFFNAASEKEIIFTSGTTDSLNMIAFGFLMNNITQDDEIIISELEHHANIIPWQEVTKRAGAKLRYIHVKEDGDLDYEQFERIISNKTRFVSVTHASNSIGTLVNIKKIIGISHAYGALVSVDAAQTAAHIPIDVQDLDVDFLSCSSHKMYGPSGVGVLYVKQKIHDLFQPVRFGGGAVAEVTHHNAVLLGFPHTLEAGTPAIGEIIAFGAAVTYIKENFQEIMSHEQEIFNLLESELAKIPFIKILGSGNKSHIVSFIVPGKHAHDIAAFFDHHDIAVRAGTHCAQLVLKRLQYDASVRVSIGCYNDKNDIMIFIAVLKLLKQL